MYFLEHIAYCYAVYRTDLFKNIQLQYKKYGKFNDWPFMARFGDYGKIILLDDPQCLYIRRHDQQDGFTHENELSLEQIINWDMFYYNILYKDNGIFNKSKYFYQKKLYYFMDGKFSLLQKTKSNINIESLHKMSNKMGLIAKYKYIYNDRLYREYLKFLRISGLNTFSKTQNLLLYIQKLYLSLRLFLKCILCRKVYDT
ncbi:MAG: hypothetical protein J5934_02465 [Succinivibrio sp.]|nr:hypothetical protein [Succinivibrio sp.]